MLTQELELIHIYYWIGQGLEQRTFKISIPTHLLNETDGNEELAFTVKLVKHHQRHHETRDDVADSQTADQVVGARLQPLKLGHHKNV